MATQPQRTANSIPALAPEREVRWPKRAKSKLANGLKVILLESHTIPKFHGELYFRSGNPRNTPAAKSKNFFAVLALTFPSTQAKTTVRFPSQASAITLNRCCN